MIWFAAVMTAIAVGVLAYATFTLRRDPIDWSAHERVLAVVVLALIGVTVGGLWVAAVLEAATP